MRKKILLPIIVIILFVILTKLATSQVLTNTSKKTSADLIVERGPVSIGSPAPIFRLMGLDDNSVKLDEYKGKVVILNFWATWCSPCKEEMPILNEYGAQHSDSVVIIGVAVMDSVESIRSFIQQSGVSYSILIDETGVVGSAYHVVGYPTTYFIDTEGMIRGKYVGTLSPRVLQQNLIPLGITQ